jgi:hypothetical protein
MYTRPLDLDHHFLLQYVDLGIGHLGWIWISFLGFGLFTLFSLYSLDLSPGKTSGLFLWIQTSFCSSTSFIWTGPLWLGYRLPSLAVEFSFL